MKVLKGTIIIFVFLFLINNIYSQSVTFKKVYPGFAIDPYIYRLSCKPYNNDKSFIIAAGELMKINLYGNLKSVSDFTGLGGQLEDFIINDSSIFLYCNGANNKNFAKLDTSFNFKLVKQFDSLNWWQAAVDRNIICSAINNGFLFSGGKGILMPVIAKSDSSGNIIWSKYFSGIQGGIQDLIQTQDSGFVVAVNLKKSAASLIKTDKNGNVLWAKSYFRPRGFVHSLVENTDGTLIMTGSIDSINTWPNYELYTSPLFITKLDKNGNVILAKTFETANGIRTWPSHIKKTIDSGYIILATMANPNQTDDLLLIKLDSNVDTLWVRAHGSPSSFDCGHSIEQLNDKGYIITGGTNNNIPVPASSLYLIRTDSMGHTDSLCEEYSLPLAINNIIVNDSNINVTAVPFTVHTSIPDTSTQNFTTYAYDGCHLDAIPELYAEQTAPIVIFPNPTDGLFSIETKMNSPVKTDIEIYNINSKKIYSSSTNKNIININLKGLASGLYFIRMSNERWVKTGKIIME